MNEILGVIAFLLSILSLIFVINRNMITEKDNYKIYNECYQIEEKYYCK